MYYYGNSDAHVQFPPESITVSLNLILPKVHSDKRRQYEFEFLETNGKARIILGNLDRLTQMRTLIDTAMKLGDCNSIELIRKIAMTHSNEQMRAIAWRAILAHDPDKTTDLAIALEDQSEYVKASLAEFIKN